MVTSCKWQQMKLLAPEGNASKIVYLISQFGRQRIELAGKTVTTDFRTQASRLEFVTIQEALLAQRPPQEEELTAQFLRCEEELLEGSMRLKGPFEKDNISRVELVVVPFSVFYFSFWLKEAGDPVVAAIPVSLFNGSVAYKLIALMRQFPLTATGISTIVAPNFSLEEAFEAATATVEFVLSNAETGKSSLVWCDTALTNEHHCRTYEQKDGAFTWEYLQWDENKHQVLGVLPVEYVSTALVLVPHVILTLREPVQGTTCGLLDPVLQNVYLLAHDVSTKEP